MSDIEVKKGMKVVAMPKQVTDDVKPVLQQIYDEVMQDKTRLEEILILGVDDEGHLIWSGSSNRADALWMIEAFKHKILFGKGGD